MCVLHVKSDTDSLSEFVAKAGLPVYMAHEKGDLLSLNPDDPSYYDDSGFSCAVSDKDWDNFQGQVEDAISFLQQYELPLLDLIARYHITDMRLDFPMTSRIANHPACFSQCDYLAPELLQLAGRLGIGIEISQYRGSKDDDLGETILRMDQHFLTEQANAINSYEDLRQFLRAFELDLRAHPDEWENNTLPQFLEAMASWTDDSDGYFANRGETVPQEPSWRFIAEMLLASKVYE